MSKCGKCGNELKENTKFCTSCGGNASLDDKKARVMGQEKTWVKAGADRGRCRARRSRADSGSCSSGPSAWAGTPCSRRTVTPRPASSNATVVTAQNGDVRIPVKTVEDGNSHFFAYTTGGKTVSFFVMKAADGSHPDRF